MNLLSDIATYLTKKGHIQGEGIDCFRDYNPDTPDDQVVLSEYSGTPMALQEEAVHRSVQVLVRSRQPKKSREWSWKIHKALQSSTRYVQLTADRWGLIYLRQTPYKLKVDAKARTYYVFNFGITTEQK